MGGYIGARAGSLSTTTVANVQDVTATDTTPEVTIINNTHEDTDGGREGKVIFKGQQSGGQESTLAEIQASHDGTANDEKGDLIFKTNDGSDGASPTEAMRITSQQRVGILTNDPSHALDVTQTGATSARVGGTGSSGANDGTIIINSGGTGDAMLRFDYETNTDRARIGTSTSGQQLEFYTAGDNERMRIDSGGHSFFTLGTDAMGSFSDGISEVGSGNFCLQVSNTAQSALKPLGFRAEDIRFATGSAERMRIASSGTQVFIGTTSTVGSSNAGLELSGTDGNNFYRSATTVTTGYDQLVFINGNGVVGRITTSGSGTSYSTGSDYRLKENVTDVSDGITRLKQLSPKRFNFIADADTTVDGFLAHEAATVVPEAVSGTKDAVEVWKEHEELPDGVSVGDNKLDDDGNTIPDYQSIDQAKLVPLLTAALQEAIAKIETLETKVDALEAE